MIRSQQDELSLRRAAAADLPGLKALFGEIDRHHARLLPGDFRARASARPRRTLLGWIEDRRGLFLVCERDGGMVGFLRATLETPPALPFVKPYRYLKIHDLVVARSARQSGIGSALMAEAEKWAKAKRARRVQLNVFAKNHEAATFYDELGYEVLSARLEKRL